MTEEEVRWWNNRAEECRQINYVIGKIQGYLCEHPGATDAQIAEGLGLDRSHAPELGRIRTTYVAGCERAATEIELYPEERPQATAGEIARTHVRPGGHRAAAVTGRRHSFSSSDLYESGDLHGISNPPGMPRPLLDGVPVPWAEYPLDEREGDHMVAWEDDHHVYQVPVQLQDPARLYEAFYDRLCVLCGERLGDPVFLFANIDESVVAQGGLHRRCARFTNAHCPGVRYRTLLSVPAGMWEELVVEAGHPDACSAIQPHPGWLQRAYEQSEEHRA